MARRAVEVERTPWAALLLHVGACTEAIAWVGRKNISARELAECPRNDWLNWLAAKARTRPNASWGDWVDRLAKMLSGDGYGDGSGAGYGDGYGYGDGDDIIS